MTVDITTSMMRPVTGITSQPWADIKNAIETSADGETIRWAPGDYFGGYESKAPVGFFNIGANSRLVIDKKNPTTTQRWVVGSGAGDVKIRSFQGYHGNIEPLYSDSGGANKIPGPEVGQNWKTAGKQEDRTDRTIIFDNACSNITIEGEGRFLIEYGVSIQPNNVNWHENIVGGSDFTGKGPKTVSGVTYSFDLRGTDRQQVIDDFTAYLLNVGINPDGSGSKYVPAKNIIFNDVRFTKRGFWCGGGLNCWVLGGSCLDTNVSEGGSYHQHRSVGGLLDNFTVQMTSFQNPNVPLLAYKTGSGSPSGPPFRPCPGHDFNEGARHSNTTVGCEVRNSTFYGWNPKSPCRGVTEDVGGFHSYFHDNVVGQAGIKNGPDIAYNGQGLVWHTIVEFNIANGSGSASQYSKNTFNDIAAAGEDRLCNRLVMRCNDFSDSNNLVGMDTKGIKNCTFFKNKLPLTANDLVKDKNSAPFLLREDGTFGSFNNTWNPFETNQNTLPSEAWLRTHQAPACAPVVIAGVLGRPLKNGIINRFLRGGSGTPYSFWEVALLTTMPSDDLGTGLVQVSAGNYGHQLVDFAPASGGMAANQAQIKYLPATVAYGTVVGVAIYGSNGDFLGAKSLATPITIAVGEQAVFAPGVLTFTFD